MTDTTPSDLKRTACSRRNRIECDECGEPLETETDNIRNVRWGFWDAENQWFERGRHYDEYYCPTCWREHFKRDAAAHYEVTDASTLWNVLEAADGDLVADLRPIFVGGRPWIRVVDGELQCLSATREMVERGEECVLTFDVEETSVDREWFDDTFRADQDLPDDAHPTIVLLKPADETPFDEWEPLPEDQSTVENYGIEVGDSE